MPELNRPHAERMVAGLTSGFAPQSDVNVAPLDDMARRRRASDHHYEQALRFSAMHAYQRASESFALAHKIAPFVDRDRVGSSHPSEEPRAA